MSRARLMLIALGMAFALPALTIGAGSREQAIDPETCATQPPPDHEDARWRWRLHAYHYLDCATAIAERALRTGDAATKPGGRIEISREELERIRTLTLWARDSAARIGH